MKTLLQKSVVFIFFLITFGLACNFTSVSIWPNLFFRIRLNDQIPLIGLISDLFEFDIVHNVQLRINVFPKVNQIDNAFIVFVPAGEFFMGSSDINARDDELPFHRVYLDAFWIYQLEVTNQQFNKFVEKTGYVTDAERSGCSYVFDGEEFVLVKGAYWAEPKGYNSSIKGHMDDPVLHMSWEDASQYCNWAGGQLPTEAEWEKAARGTKSYAFPWGNYALHQKLANYGKINESVTPVGNYPAGVIPYGALDMAGNVWEWVSDWYDCDYYSHSPYRNPTGPAVGDCRVSRGGSWLGCQDTLRTAFRSRCAPDMTFDFFGFRCVLNP